MAMVDDIAVAFSAAAEIMAMTKAELIERQGWDKPIKCEALAIASKTAKGVYEIMEAANARQLCAMAEFADVPQPTH